VYLVGAGPGAPDLLTLRAARLLEAADVVLHDALVHPDTLALARRARLVNVGKRSGRVCTDQRFIDRALVESARRHDVVVRLKGGDPMIFGRAQEELDALDSAGIEAEVVPGVTAALAAAAALRVSLTRRGLARTVAFVTPRVGRGETASEWLPAALGADSVALYMAAGAAPAEGPVVMLVGEVLRDCERAAIEDPAPAHSVSLRTA
jgi:uroporphyrin-III C-methyltransferase